MAMLEMLSKMIGAIKLFARVTLSEFVNVSEMVDAIWPVRRMIRKFLPTETTVISC